MNLNLGTIACEECGNSFSCRVGFSNRSKQLFSITCKECASLSTITVLDGKLSKSGLVDTSEKPKYHIDLHLDFPVFEREEYTLISPFMNAMMMLDKDSDIFIHGHNMNLLNVFSDNINDIEKTFKFYMDEKYKLFSEKVNKAFNINIHIEDKLQAEQLLFDYLWRMMEPFTDNTLLDKQIEDFEIHLIRLKENSSIQLKSFLDEIESSAFTKNSIFDTLKICRQLLKKEVIFRPALFIDFDESYSDNSLPYRLSTEDFEYISDLFQSISEVLSRQLTIVAGLNNLLKRNNHNLFQEVLSTRGRHLEPSSLKKYSDFDFGKKMEHIDSSWYQISNDIADNQLRNSTAHFKWDYDSVTQTITYYPKKEGLLRNTSQTIYLIDYCKKIINSFRIVHELNYLCHNINLLINAEIAD